MARQSMARLLTEEEIDSILSEMKPPMLPPYMRDAPFLLDSALANHDALMEENRKSLRTIYLVPQQLDTFRDTLVRSFYTRHAQPGDAVGIVAGQSIGARQTQLTLNTFHSAGLVVDLVVTGIPRFTEIINTQRKTGCVVAFPVLRKRATDPKDIREIRTLFNSEIIQCTLRALVLSIETLSIETLSIETCAEPESGEWWEDMYFMIHPEDAEQRRALPVRTRLWLDPIALFRAEQTPYVLARRLQEKTAFECICIPSPTSIARIDVLTDSETPWDTSSLDIALSGFGNIQCAHYNYTGGEWTVQTEGSSLSDLIAHPSLDGSKVFCNDLWEMYEVLGLEATRVFLIREITGIVSTDVYAKHVELLVDMMLYMGSLTPISRYGVHRSQSEVLSKTTFEKMFDHFLGAGFFAEQDSTTSVSASIMCGKRSRTGTGACDLLVDLNAQYPDEYIFPLLS